MIEYVDGVIAVGEKQTDFLMEADVNIPALPEQDNKIFEYSQWEIPNHRSDCTLYGPIGALSDLTNYEFSLADIESVRSLAHERGKVDNKGWYVQDGVKCVCDWRNNNKKDKMLYFRLDLMEAKTIEALAKGYSIVVSYRGNGNYNLDKSIDGVLNAKNIEGVTTYGHCTRIRNKEDKKTTVVIDSYKGNQYNIYVVEWLSDLIKNNIFNSLGYLIIPESLMKKTKEEIERLNQMIFYIKTIIENNSKLREITNDEKLKNILNKQNNILRDKKSFIEKQL